MHGNASERLPWLLLLLVLRQLTFLLLGNARIILLATIVLDIKVMEAIVAIVAITAMAVMVVIVVTTATIAIIVTIATIATTAIQVIVAIQVIAAITVTTTTITTTIIVITSIISTTLIISIMLLISVLPLMIGSSELFVIAAIVLLLFGAKKIPELMKSMGQGVRYFKKGMNEDLQENNLDSKGEENEVQLPKEDK